LAVFSALSLTCQDKWPKNLGIDYAAAITQAKGFTGNIFVSSHNDGCIYELGAQGTYMQSHYLPAYKQISGLTVASNGHFIASFVSSDVAIWDPTSSLENPVSLQPPGDSWRPWSITADLNKRRVLIPDNCHGSVYEYTEDGQYAWTLISGLETPTDVEVGSTGEIYVVEYLVSGKLKEYDSNGALLRVYGKALRWPLNVAVVPDGAVFVTEPYNGRINKITCM
jgi:hypothetical protein